jgi:thymidylate kinase
LVRNEIVLLRSLCRFDYGLSGRWIRAGRNVHCAAQCFATDGLLPQVTFLLDIDPLVGLRRRASIAAKVRIALKSVAFSFSAACATVLAEAAQQIPSAS